MARGDGAAPLFAVSRDGSTPLWPYFAGRVVADLAGSVCRLRALSKQPLKVLDAQHHGKCHQPAFREAPEGCAHRGS